MSLGKLAVAVKQRLQPYLPVIVQLVKEGLMLPRCAFRLIMLLTLSL
jgi:hypothetical protein